MLGLDCDGLSRKEINAARRIFSKQRITVAARNELKAGWEKRFGKKFPAMKFSINLYMAKLDEPDDGTRGWGCSFDHYSKELDKQKEESRG